VKATTVH
jgi:hypothetical protein